jgi:hypothetical protein
MADPRGVSAVAKQCNHPVGQAKAIVHLPQQQHPSIGGDLLPVRAKNGTSVLELKLDR